MPHGANSRATGPLESSSFKAHTDWVCGGAGMPQSGPIAGPIEGKTFYCPHCGALYSVTHSRPPKDDIEKCVVCREIMDRANAVKLSVYKLVYRAEDAERVELLARAAGF